MLRDLFLAAGLLALLALATATIPSHILLRNSWRFRVAVGLTAGLAAGANMALPALQQVMVPPKAVPHFKRGLELKKRVNIVSEVAEVERLVA